MSNIKLFEDKEVRTFWDEKEEQWYFSIVDVVEVLTNSANHCLNGSALGDGMD